MNLALLRQAIGLPVLTAIIIGLFPTVSVAGYISPAASYAWSENTGWVNFRPTYGGAVVSATHLSGYVWQENTGWLKLGSDGGGPYPNTTATNWGVNRDPAGNLSGYAWSEGWGWINFKPTGGGVSIDALTGAFDGYAWGENIGWIRFSNPQGAPVPYAVGLGVFTLTLTIQGTGTGSVVNPDPPFSCNAGCTQRIMDAPPLNLSATANQYSLVDGWSGCDTVAGADCLMAMDRDRTATVTFTKDTHHTARIVGPPTVYFPTLQDAYTNAGTGSAAIQVWGLDLAETLDCGFAATVSISGGYDQQYQNRPGTTTIRGLTIRRGKVTVDRVVVR